MWLGTKMKTEIGVSMLGMVTQLPISDVADGCCGCILVFRTKKQAVKYCGKEAELIKVREGADTRKGTK